MTPALVIIGLKTEISIRHSFRWDGSAQASPVTPSWYLVRIAVSRLTAEASKLSAKAVNGFLSMK